jgi:alpha-glucosidase
MILNLGLSGQPFSGPDIGGFDGNGDGAMFARWMGIGALLPFARGHTAKNTRAKEPWAFGPEVDRVSRMALERRYRLLPHLYTLFREASATGLPVARPLFFADPADPSLRAVDDSFLLGADVLVRARTSPGGPASATMPRGTWRALRVVPGEQNEPDLPELFVRAGAIVPLGPVLQWSDEKPLDALELVAALDADGRAEGVLYEDDGDGFGYRDGAYRLVSLLAERSGDVVRVSARVAEGAWTLPGRPITARVLVEGREVRATATGHDVEVSLAPEE